MQKKLAATLLAAAMVISATPSVNAQETDSITIGVSSVTYESLVPWQGATEYSVMVYEALGARDEFSGTFYGVLMKEYTQVDELTYDVTIYDYIYDSEGNHITAEDVAFSWNTCQELGELTETFTVESITAIDDYTVRFVWGSTPALGDFEAQMCNVVIVSQAAYETSGNGMATNPVGTGCYVVSEWTSGVSITLTARDDYWQEEELRVLNQQQAPVTTVKIDTITESSQLAMALQTGTIDASADVSVDDLTSFQEGGAYADQYSVEVRIGVKGYVLYPNLSENSPLADENLRKAVFTIINKDFLAAAIQGGSCEVLYAMGSSKYSDYNEDWSELDYTYDVETAKEYLAASAYPDGVELTLITPSMGYNEDIATILKEQLSEIGVTLNIEAQQFSNYLANEGDSTAWDFTIAFLSSDDYITNCWAKYFDVDVVGTDLTKNFIYDEELQTLMDTCTSVDGHTEENIDATWIYIMENAYCYPLILPSESVVYNSSKIESIAFSGMDKFLASGFVYY